LRLVFLGHGTFVYGAISTWWRRRALSGRNLQLFGVDLARVLPYNIARAWHLQLALFWVVTSFLAAGIFLVPMITGREPRGQSLLSYLLAGALVVVVVGSTLGEYAGIQGWIQKGWAWFGNQGFTFLDLGRFPKD
jgi:nitric oxide reductase subunit B